MVFESLATIGLGVLLGLSLAAPPGPVNAVIASNAVTKSWRAGFLVGAGALTADAGFLTLSVLAHSVIEGVRTLFPFIALVGAAVMASFAWGAARAWHRVPDTAAVSAKAHATSYVTGLAINLTSPYPILWWLTAGLALIDQLGATVLAGFFAGVLLWIALFPFALRVAQRRFSATYRAALVFSIVCLVAFAAWLAWSAVAALL